MLAAALNAALAELRDRYGPDRTKWRWGRAHRALSEHRPFGAVPCLARCFNVEVDSGGGNYTLNRGEADFEMEPPFANRHAANLRADLRPRRPRPLAVHGADGPVGQPALALLPLLRGRWAKGEYIEIATRRDAIAKASLGTWQLVPK